MDFHSCHSYVSGGYNQRQGYHKLEGSMDLWWFMKMAVRNWQHHTTSRAEIAEIVFYHHENGSKDPWIISNKYWNAAMQKILDIMSNKCGDMCNIDLNLSSNHNEIPLAIQPHDVIKRGDVRCNVVFCVWTEGICYILYYNIGYPCSLSLEEEICWINQKGSNMFAGAVDPVLPSPTIFLTHPFHHPKHMWFHPLHPPWQNWGIFHVFVGWVWLYNIVLIVGWCWLVINGYKPSITTPC